MPSKPAAEPFNEALKLAYIMRGSILNEVALLEVMIDIFIATHFCANHRERKDFLTMVLPSNVVIFENKRAIFKKLIEKYYPSFKAKMPNYHAFLETVRDYRNKFAHYTLNITPKAIEVMVKTNRIVLLDNTKKSITFTFSEISDLIEAIKKMSGEVAKAVPK